MTNIEAMLREYLQSKLGVPVFVAVPENPPKTFVTVERTGGASNPPLYDNPTVVVDYWSDTRSNAWVLANRGDNALYMFKFEPNIVDVEFDVSCVHYPDERMKGERYESTYLITTYMKQRR